MLKIFKIASRVELWALASVAFTMSACGVFWAGGVDEETNTVAGVDPEDSKPDAIASADSIVPTIDTSYFTNQPIEIVKPPETGTRLVITNPDPVYDEPSPPPTDDTELHDFTGRLYNGNGEALNITVELKDGGNVSTKTDAAGYFQLNALPVGVYPLIVSSGNSNDGVAYLLKNSSTDTDLLGPVPSSVISSITESDFEAPDIQNFNYKDEGPGGAGCPPLPQSGSSSSYQPSSSSSQIIYLSSGSGVSVMASNELPHDVDYGVLYRWETVENGSTEENSNQEIYWYSEWTVEVNFELGSIDSENSYRKNIFGKFTGSNGVFALTIINGICGTEAPSYALFSLRYGSFDCREAVISTAPVETGKKVSLTGTFEGQMLMLYKDGFKIAQKYIGYRPPQDFNTSPFVFGDEELDLKLKDVRLGEKAITSADVLYRYYQ